MALVVYGTSHTLGFHLCFISQGLYFSPRGGAEEEILPRCLPEEKPRRVQWAFWAGGVVVVEQYYLLRCEALTEAKEIISYHCGYVFGKAELHAIHLG